MNAELLRDGSGHDAAQKAGQQGGRNGGQGLQTTHRQKVVQNVRIGLPGP